MNIIDDLKSQFKFGDIVTKLIFWNIAMFVIPFLVFGFLNLLGIRIDYISYFSLSSNPADLLWKPWSLLTYAFFHADFFHILFQSYSFEFRWPIVFNLFHTKNNL